MSRSTSVMGLSAHAISFLRKNGKKILEHKCPSCGHEYGGFRLQCEVYDNDTGRRAGMFDDGPDLYEYELQDGKIVREVVQAAPWSSGPCIFLCLEDENGNRMFEWPQEEIDNC